MAQANQAATTTTPAPAKGPGAIGNAAPISGTPTAAPAPAVAAAGHNSGAVAVPTLPPSDEKLVQAWLDQCKQYGEQAGAGETTTVAWYQDMVTRAYRGEITVNDAERGYDAFMDARRKRAGALGKRTGNANGSSKGVRSSETKKMIRMGGLPLIRDINNGGLGVFNTAIKVINGTPDLKGEVAKMLLKVATAQNKSPAEPYDEAGIRTMLAPKDPTDRGEGEYLNAAKKQIELAVTKGGGSWDPHKRAAVTSITARMEQINYKTAQERRLEEMAQKAQAKAKQKAQAKKKR
jgi:hypothetical protein